MPNISSAELAQAQRQDAQPTRRPDEMLAVWIPGRLESRLNGPQGRTLKGATWRAKKIKEMRERVGAAILNGLFDRMTWQGAARAVSVDPFIAKSVHFIAYVGHEWDEDNLKASCKPYRDALVAMAIIDDDRPSAGHRFAYEQSVDRARAGKRGVEIRVRLRHRGCVHDRWTDRESSA